ncbi:hypothetical protein PRIPAC_97527 [Pristionchus pacificus]|uniref:Uncharacterized protein n=1 Tax=Pristionchus pacificus TaxID=54126 RepID=A0A454XV65_PRIPA|nr:hypothetical protein PRIPAC_97527 [Pristionchus pacificus]|eukprot:PDM65813.1 hypothetical protein PRIPAC_45214 [Pristionchus pacificus]
MRAWFYADSSKCVLLGVARTPPPGQRPLPYTCYAKATTGCPVHSPDPARAYVPGPSVPGELGACRKLLAATPSEDQRTVLECWISISS